MGFSWEKDRIGWCQWTVAVNAAQIRYYEATWTQNDATCHPHGTIYNARLGGTMPPLGSSVDPGDGGSSTIQNSKSRTSIYRGWYLVHTLFHQGVYCPDHPVLHHCTIPVMIWGLILIWFHWQMLSRCPFTRPVSVHLPHIALDLIIEICKL